MYAAELLLPPNRSFGQPAAQNPNAFILIPGLLVVGGIVASGLVYYRSRQQQERQAREESAADTTAHADQSAGKDTRVPGVTMGSHVVMNENLWAFVKELRQRLNFDIHITSAVRDAEGQARAMHNNYKNKGGREYFIDLYGSKYGGGAADALESGGEAALAEFVRQDVAKGKAVGHVAGKGLDFRISTLTPEQQNELLAVGKSLGVGTLHEGDHIHMDKIGNSAMQEALAAAAEAARLAAEAAEQAAALARKNRNLAIGASVVGAVVLLGGVYYAVTRQ